MEVKEVLRRARGAAIAADESCRVLDCNAAARELLGLTDGQRLVGRKLGEVLEAYDVFGNRLGSEYLSFGEMLVRGEAINDFQIRARNGNGKRVPLAVSVLAVLDRASSDYSLVYLLRKVLRRRKADEVIERMLASGTAPVRSIGPELTPRQMDVLRLLSSGRTVDEIASELSVTVHTVRSHVQSVLRKLDAHSQVAAVAIAYSRRLL